MKEKVLRKIELITRDNLETKFKECLEQRQMPDYFLYLDSSGVKNWLDLDSSEGFPIASRLTDLLRQSLPSITKHFPRRLDLVSIGVGNGEKERMLLEALIPRCQLHYCAVDISSQMVDEALNTVADIDMEKTGIVAFLEDLPLLRQFWSQPAVLCLLGNNFCNYEPDYLLKTLHSQLECDDLFLFDCHLFPAPPESVSRKQVEQIYRSPLNVRFNIDPLVRRGLDPDNCAFYLELLPTETSLGRAYRTSKWLHILKDSTLSSGPDKISLAAGDTIGLGFTYKYTDSQVEGYLKHYGFHKIERFLSSDGNNLLLLACKQPA